MSWVWSKADICNDKSVIFWSAFCLLSIHVPQENLVAQRQTRKNPWFLRGKTASSNQIKNNNIIIRKRKGNQWSIYKKQIVIL